MTAISPRLAGAGLLAYGVLSPLAFMTSGSPGGTFDEHVISTFTSSSHWPIAMGMAYVGVLGTLGLLPFAARQRARGAGGEVVWGLVLAGVGVSVVGWFLVGGLAVGFAEGGAAVRSVPHPVIYLLTEVGNLLAVCGPALLAGVAALVLAVTDDLSARARAGTVILGICGIVAAAFFPLFLFWLGAIVVGVRTLRSAAAELPLGARLQEA